MSLSAAPLGYCRSRRHIRHNVFIISLGTMGRICDLPDQSWWLIHLRSLPHQHHYRACLLSGRPWMMGAAHFMQQIHAWLAPQLCAIVNGILRLSRGGQAQSIIAHAGFRLARDAGLKPGGFLGLISRVAGFDSPARYQLG